jgi:uncharacterized protein (DUF433 family)
MKTDLYINYMNSTAIGETAVYDVDSAYSFYGASVSEALPSVEFKWSSLLENALRAFRNATIVHCFVVASQATGDYVKFLPKYHYCPILIGNDDRRVALYEFVEALDGAVDYDQLKEEFPNLSFAQINGAISFLRKITQFNTQGIDIDEMEDLETANDPHLIEALKKAIVDQETSRVLDHSERNR